MVSELLRKYIWLIQTLIKAGDGGLSLDELGEKWEDRFGTPYPRRTFNNHREAVEDIFGIRIECDRSRNAYFIRSGSDAMDRDSASAWMINTFTINNILSLSRERLSGRVSVEEIPSGQKYLTLIMDAMLEGRELKCIYRKYLSSGDGNPYTLRPYALKEAAKRWYLIAYCNERGAVRVYGLDRISGLELSENRFSVPQGFDVDELFATSYGVYMSDTPACEIVFRASAKDAEYLDDLPMHGTQKKLSEDGNGTVFSIFVSPNTSLMMDFLSYGSRLEVLSPADIREKIKEEALKMTKIYEQ